MEKIRAPEWAVKEAGLQDLLRRTSLRKRVPRQPVRAPGNPELPKTPKVLQSRPKDPIKQRTLRLFQTWKDSQENRNPTAGAVREIPIPERTSSAPRKMQLRACRISRGLPEVENRHRTAGTAG